MTSTTNHEMLFILRSVFFLSKLIGKVEAKRYYSRRISIHSLTHIMHFLFSASLLILLGTVLQCMGYFSYLKGTLRGDIKPNRVSWMMWSLAPLIGTGSALASGSDVLPTVSIFLAGFLPLFVLVGSFWNKKSEWHIGVFDVLCGLLSVLALILWMLIHQPLLALLFSAIGDFFAYIPTMKKAWTHPETEHGLPYITGILSTILILFSAPVWNVQNCGFQLYLIVANSMLLFCIYRKHILSYLDV